MRSDGWIRVFYDEMKNFVARVVGNRMLCG
jgi:hypothetical protein